MVTKKIHLRDSSEALKLLGQHDQNLRLLEKANGVQIFGRGLILSIRGAPSKVEKTLRAIQAMREQVTSAVSALQAPVVEPHPAALSRAEGAEPVYITFSGRPILPQTEQQKRYVEAMRAHDLVIAIGPGGTGKTFLAAACALAALKEGKVTRIVLTRPVVEAGEKLGFLPGDFYEKVNPYLRPLYDAFYGMLGSDRFRIYQDDETVEIVPLAYMRGRTLDDAFIILDEAQNTSPSQMKMFLTRMGMGSQAVITGDVTQIDLEKKHLSGLVRLREILGHIPGVAFVSFSEADVVRHGLVREIIKAYEGFEKRQENP